MNPQPLHLDAEFSKSTEFGQSQPDERQERALSDIKKGLAGSTVGVFNEAYDAMGASSENKTVFPNVVRVDKS